MMSVILNLSEQTLNPCVASSAGGEALSTRFPVIRRSHSRKRAMEDQHPLNALGGSLLARRVFE